ncbi:MAG: restriction endonuclease [Bacteroidetes bacterium]|nr:restriction endonuclease [Bacteroidota bacterium]
MASYNYLDLSPAEFEDLSRDLIQVREGIFLESFKSGKDKGIDFRYKDDGVYIVLQAKRYEHYRDLKQALVHKELAKARSLKPSRYILVTSVDLTVSQKEELLLLFKGLMVKESDILGKKDLNNLLEQTKYENVKKTHYKLWLTSLNLLADAVDQVVYRKEYNLARAEWDTIRQESKYYVQNKSFLEALDRIAESRMVLITGTPGSGKTTLGYALISYFHAKEGYDDLIPIRHIDQAWHMLKEGKKQIFFYDDFLGDINFKKFLNNEDIYITKFIRRIGALPDKILILTTREYVFRQAELLHPELKKDFYKLSRCIVSPETYSEYIKAKILYNHLYFSGLHSNQILTLTSRTNYQTIIRHPNYTPRLIARYIEVAARHKDKEGRAFFNAFKKYLDHPREFWKDIYEKLSPASQLFLLVMFSTNDPIYLDHLKEAYTAAVDRYTRKFNNLIVTPDTLESVLKELSDTFITIELEDWQGHVLEFQNPSIKDFLLEYLRGREELIEIILESAIFLNQLVYAFGTRDGSLEVDNFEKPFDGQRITLRGKLYTIYRDSFLKKFENLAFCSIQPSAVSDLKTYRHPAEDLLTLKLSELLHIFGMQDEIVRSFIIEKFEKILSDYKEESDAKILNLDSSYYFPYIVKAVRPFVKIDETKLLNDFYDSITFSSEYADLHTLGELYPAAFDALLKKNINNIKKHIKQLLEKDIYYFQERGMDIEVDHTRDLYWQLFDLYNIPKTKAFENRFKNALDRPRPSEKEQREEEAQIQKERKEIEKTQKDIDLLFSSLEAALTSDGAAPGDSKN